MVSISASDSTKGTSELLVHTWIDSNLSLPAKTDIITPNFSIVSTNFRDGRSKASKEDISDSSYLIRHKKKELFEKKAKNRAKEVYRYELHSKMLRRESSAASFVSTQSMNSEKNIDTDELWYQKWVESKDQPLVRVGVFNGEELYGIDQNILEELIKSKEIQSDYLPVHTPVDMAEQELETKRPRSARKKVSK